MKPTGTSSTCLPKSATARSIILLETSVLPTAASKLPSSRLAFLAGCILLIAATAAGVVYYSRPGAVPPHDNNQNGSARETEQPGATSDTPGYHFITGVYRGSAQPRYDTREALKKALPLRAGDQLVLQGPVPAHMHIALFVLTLSDPKLDVKDLGPIEISNGRFLCKNRLELSGPQATEVIFACGSLNKTPTELEVAALLSNFLQSNPFKKGAYRLPTNFLLSFQTNSVDKLGQYPLSHVGVVEDPVQVVADRLEKLRLKLREKYEFVAGVCFTYEGAPAEQLQLPDKDAKPEKHNTSHEDMTLMSRSTSYDSVPD